MPHFFAKFVKIGSDIVSQIYMNSILVFVSLNNSLQNYLFSIFSLCL